MIPSHLPRRRVVVTAMDAISCLGNTLPDIENSLRQGISGIQVIPERVELGFRSPLSGVVDMPDPKQYLDRRVRKTMGEAALGAAICAMRCIERSGCADIMESPRTGLIIGNDSSAEVIPATLDTIREKKSTGTLGSDKVIKSLNSTATINLNPLIKNQGISLTLSAACASGTHSLGLAYTMIALGMQDTVVAGGVQETNWMSMAAFDGLRVFSTRTDDAAAASRPFDKNRDGLVPSGGSAILILEEYEQAKARGAPILAEIKGYAFSSDGHHLTAADGEGAIRCLTEVLTQAGLEAKDVDYINAHATSTPTGDKAEAYAINKVFGDNCPPVSSTKSLTGHECWMAGASESIYSILMMQGNFIAPNINYETADPELDTINIIAETQENVRLDNMISNGFGFGGTNACLAFGRAP